MNKGKHIAVLGAGTMGAGIAAQYAMSGYDVKIYSRTEDTLRRACKTVEKNSLLMQLEMGFSELDAESMKNRISYTASLECAVTDAWYVVETVVENIEVKKKLYEQLDNLLDENVIISSNTSFLNIFEFLPERRQPYGIIAHWFAPAHILPLVEVVKGPETKQEVVEAVVNLHRDCGKRPVVMDRYVPGFIVNRLQSAMTREVIYLLENEYCTEEAIDVAVKTSLMPRGLLLGLVQRMDFTGIDMVANGLKNKTYHPAPQPDEDNLIFKMTENGKIGVKSGAGFYDYDHASYEDILYKRDAQLLKSVRLAEQLMDEPLHNKKK